MGEDAPKGLATHRLRNMHVYESVGYSHNGSTHLAHRFVGCWPQVRNALPSSFTASGDVRCSRRTVRYRAEGVARETRYSICYGGTAGLACRHLSAGVPGIGGTPFPIAIEAGCTRVCEVSSLQHHPRPQAEPVGKRLVVRRPAVIHAARAPQQEAPLPPPPPPPPPPRFLIAVHTTSSEWRQDFAAHR